MRGTGNEVLEWITHHNEFAPLMQISRQRLVGLRERMRKGSTNEVAVEQMLERLKKRMESLKDDEVGATFCRQHELRKLRDAYVLPAIVRDHHGKFFNELTFIKMVSDEEQMHDLNLRWQVSVIMARGDYPSKEVVREALRRKGWNLFEERMVLPSVWEVV